MHLARIALLEIAPPEHPTRAIIDEQLDAELTADIKEHGVISPLHIKRIRNGYEVTAGHRRYRCAIAAGLATVPCLILEEGDTTDLLVKVHENLFRQDLSAVEEAAFYAELMESQGNDVDRVCELVGRERAHVEGRLLLLNGDRKVLEAVAAKQISLGVAEQLNRARRVEDRHYLLDWAILQGATVSVVRQWVFNYNSRPDSAKPEDGPPPVSSAPAQSTYTEPKCFICGKSDSQHEMVFRYNHSSCEKVIERQAEAAK